ncbi:MAG: hypothetical protein NTX73_00345 [Rhodobacterales bacterium]|nr:hypothetical protein [Rhodobacterales bacterium]
MTGYPLLFPGASLGTAASDSGYALRRGAVEITVKSGYPAILTEIDAGGGPILTQAMDQAGVPAQDRPTRIIQLQSDMALYQANPAALVAAIMVYGKEP